MSISPQDLPYPGRPYIRAELVTFAQLAERVPAGTGEVLFCVIGGIPCWCFPNAALDAWIVSPVLAKGALADGKVLVSDASEDSGFVAMDYNAGGSTLIVQDNDGTPLITGVTKIKFPNGSVAQSGTEATITFTGSSGGFSTARRTIVRLDTQISVPGDQSTLDAIPFGTELDDELSGWSAGSPTRFTNNDGVTTRYRVIATVCPSILLAGAPSYDAVGVRFECRLNGTTAHREWLVMIQMGGGGFDNQTPRHHCFSFLVELPAGEYFEIMYGSNGTLTSADSIFLYGSTDPFSTFVEIEEA